MERETHKYVIKIKYYKKKNERGEKMGIAIMVLILITVVLYLIVLASSEAEKLQNKEEKINYKSIKKAKRAIKSLAKSCRQEAEIRKLKNINADLRNEHDEYIILKQDYKDTLSNTITDLLDLQEINNLETIEQEKNIYRVVTPEEKEEHINAIVNKLKKEFSRKINELENPDKLSSSSKKHL